MVYAFLNEVHKCRWHSGNLAYQSVLSRPSRFIASYFYPLKDLWHDPWVLWNFSSLGQVQILSFSSANHNENQNIELNQKNPKLLYKVSRNFAVTNDKLQQPEGVYRVFVRS